MRAVSFPRDPQHSLPQGIVRLRREWQSGRMPSQLPSYHGYRFPSEIISHAVWLYYRFALSFRDVEDLLAQRGVTVTYETIRQWCLGFLRPRTWEGATRSATRTPCHAVCHAENEGFWRVLTG